MRFSLKWILIAVAYVAIAAAAFSQQSWVYPDILWAVSLLAIVFAALLAFMGRGKGRVAAAGFLLASVAYLACVAFGQISGSDVVPTKRWLVAAGYDPNAVTFYPVTSSGIAPTYQSGGYTSYPPLTAAVTNFALSYAPSGSSMAVQPPLPAATVADFGIYVRAANAVSMMLFGALGALVGLLATKRILEQTPT